MAAQRKSSLGLRARNVEGVGCCESVRIPPERSAAADSRQPIVADQGSPQPSRTFAAVAQVPCPLAAKAHVVPIVVAIGGRTELACE